MFRVVHLVILICVIASLRAAAPNDGVVGIGLDRETTDRAVIRQVMPGGPAEKANLMAGDVIVSVDGQAVKSPEQAGQLLHGAVGSTSRVRIERNGKQYEAAVTRIAPPNQPPNQQRAPAPQPNPLDANNNDHPAAQGLPAFLRPGTRLFYNQGQSVTNLNDVPGICLPGIQVDKDHMRSGGIGYFTLDIAHATPDYIAANGRFFLITDVNTGVCRSTGSAACKGDANRVESYWINPAKLGTMKEGRDENWKVFRQQITMNGKTFNAINLLDDNPANYSSRYYDLETGILLSLSQCVHNNPDPNVREGMQTMDHVRFAGMRAIKYPWPLGGAPQWAVKGATFNYQGSYGVNAGMGPLSYPLTVSIQLDDGQDGVFTATTRVSKSIGQGLPAQESTAKQVFGSAILTNLWMSPDALRKLQPNQLIDDDPGTKHRVIFQGMQNNAAVIVDQGENESTQFFYDTNNGLLTAVSKTAQNQVGQEMTQFQLVK